MKRRVVVHVHAADAGKFDESKHPRSGNGKFGQGEEHPADAAERRAKRALELAQAASGKKRRATAHHLTLAADELKKAAAAHKANDPETARKHERNAEMHREQANRYDNDD